ncbi:hypothetical protein CCR75_009369 [Bremia lactucae]|uniref:Uncharacterized protein n=1 Tax=Bremia lactucae TaxID=4779 RepID=A0A976FSL1_BRELC|nr:hypothetical protein CCR75_009369 [Bremia lactucae]
MVMSAISTPIVLMAQIESFELVDLLAALGVNKIPTSAEMLDSAPNTVADPGDVLFRMPHNPRHIVRSSSVSSVVARSRTGFLYQAVSHPYRVFFLNPRKFCVITHLSAAW